MYFNMIIKANTYHPTTYIHLVLMDYKGNFQSYNINNNK